MTRKSQATIGTRVSVNKEIKWGGYGPYQVNRLEIMLDGAGAGLGKILRVPSGTMLEVINPPKKTDGINCIEVRVDGTYEEGFVYWNHFRLSTTPV